MITSQTLTSRNVFAILTVFLSLSTLSGCSDEHNQEPVTERSEQKNPKHLTPGEQAIANEAVRKQLDEENKPLTVVFENPGMGRLDDYISATNLGGENRSTISAAPPSS